MNFSDMKEFLWERRVQLAVMLAIVSAVFALYGGWRLVSYTVPMLSGDYVAAAEGGGNEANALYDAGLKAYENEDYKSAKDLLTRAQSALTNSAGEIPNDKKAMAGRIQFALGNTYFRQKQLKAAAESYKQSLRLDPTNLEAKYNLELLQQMIVGGAGGGDPNQPGGGSNGGPKKGI
ncbi:MAG TPA: tetratricopeptide repeat protein [Candidatus Obscuribacterales bacterium]